MAFPICPVQSQAYTVNNVSKWDETGYRTAGPLKQQILLNFLKGIMSRSLNSLMGLRAPAWMTNFCIGWLIDGQCGREKVTLDAFPIATTETIQTAKVKLSSKLKLGSSPCRNVTCGHYGAIASIVNVFGQVIDTGCCTKQLWINVIMK